MLAKSGHDGGTPGSRMKQTLMNVLLSNTKPKSAKRKSERWMSHQVESEKSRIKRGRSRYPATWMTVQRQRWLIIFSSTFSPFRVTTCPSSVFSKHSLTFGLLSR